MSVSAQPTGGHSDHACVGPEAQTTRSKGGQNHREEQTRPKSQVAIQAPSLGGFQDNQAEISKETEDWSNNSTHFALVLFLEHHAKHGPLAGRRRVAVERAWVSYRGCHHGVYGLTSMESS